MTKMTDLTAIYSKKAQMKIQQMAFVLLAIMIFFAMVGLIYFTISIANVQASAEELRDNEARETVKKLSGSPELGFTSTTDCSSCIDLDKALILKDSTRYQNFWNLDFLMIEKISPESSSVECTKTNYPDCSQITLINKGGSLSTKTAIVAIAHWDGNRQSFVYELGKIHASAKILGNQSG